METFQNLINALARPEPYMALVTVGFLLLIWKVRFITRPPPRITRTVSIKFIPPQPIR